MAVAQLGSRVLYALSDSRGRISQRGEFPVNADASMVVLSDYALLEHPDVQAASASGRIGLVQPCVLRDPIALARQWVRTPAEDRVEVSREDISWLKILLVARSILVSDQQAILERVRERVRSTSSDYAEILSDEEGLIPQLLPVLRDHPTPYHLQSSAVVQLGMMLQEFLAEGRQALSDRLFEMCGPSADSSLTQLDIELAEATIPGDIDTYLQLGNRLEELDWRIYRRASQEGAGDATMTMPRRFSILEHADAGQRDDDQPIELADVDAALTRLLARRFTPERRAAGDYQDYLRLRAALHRQEAAPPADLALRIEIVGQLLALSAGRFTDAIRYRSACEELLSAAASPTSQPSPNYSLYADAALSMSITYMCAIDMAGGFPALRSAAEDPAAQFATRGILCEALGLLSLTLVFFGEHMHYPQALTQMRALVFSGEEAGPARAMAEITELFLTGGRIDTRAEVLAARRDLADEHSRDTPYRAFFNYVTMLTCYLTNEPEKGATAYTEIVHEGIWQKHNRRMNRLARLSYAIQLAGQGEFALARRELNAMQHSADRTTDGSDGVMRECIGLRLDFAVGEHKQVLSRTRPGGPLAEDQVLGVHVRRYVPLILILQGSALWRMGSTELAGQSFHRATLQAAADEEWYVIAASETLEYRAWLTSLDPDALPTGVTSVIHEALLARPMFTDRTLPALTPQQRRLIPLLAQGRSVSSIAKTLHISVNTIKNHLTLLYRKLGVSSREQAVIQAEAYGLYDLPPHFVRDSAVPED